MKKILCAFRLTAAAIRLLKLIAESMGLTQTGVVETLIRDKAKELNIK